MTAELVDTTENHISIEVFVNDIRFVLVRAIVPVLGGEAEVNEVDLLHQVANLSDTISLILQQLFLLLIPAVQLLVLVNQVLD